ncbi:MAG: class I SAM-dependent methyltransferase [Phycisphaerales bacterium]|nr:class I SAM-dependent methyltransferase [Phycisphaerales bacterium]
MEQQSWFESWFNSPYYNVLYQHRDDAEAELFAEALMRYLTPPIGSRMVDIGCGEGRFSVQFAQEGFDVVGVDIAANRIEKALEYERDNLHFFVHDMRLPFYINYFDFAFNLFTSFGYFAHQSDNIRAARAFALGLKKGGYLVVDYLNKEWVLQQLKPHDIIEREGVSFDIRKHFDGQHIIKGICFLDCEGIFRQYTERVSAFSLSDFTQLFASVGLTLEATFGNYTLDTFDDKVSPRLIMVFKK